MCSRCIVPHVPHLSSCFRMFHIFTLAELCSHGGPQNTMSCVRKVTSMDLNCSCTNPIISTFTMSCGRIVKCMYSKYNIKKGKGYIEIEEERQTYIHIDRDDTTLQYQVVACSVHLSLTPVSHVLHDLHSTFILRMFLWRVHCEH